MGDATDPLTFEFITDQEFRASLERDYAELVACLEVGATKAALVLCGSMVEAVLADYLLSTGQTEPDPLKLELGPLIDACAKAGVLDQRAKDLSSVVRSYRNLIHPGRVIRLGENVGEEDGAVALHVLRIIVREVANRQEQEFGLTAEQAATKFETDSGAPKIAEPLVSEMREAERERVIEVVPERYFEISQGEWDSETDPTLERLSVLYRAALAQLPEAKRKAAVRRYLAVLRSEAESRVAMYDAAFFRGVDLEYMTKAERALVVAHVLGGLEDRKQVPTSLIVSVAGMAAYLDNKDLGKYLDSLVRVAAYESGTARHDAVERTLRTEYRDTTGAQDERIVARLDEWIEFLDEREREEARDRIAGLRRIFATEEDIPF